MPRLLYTVRTSCPTPHLRSRYLAWLSPGHVMAVRHAGADHVRIVLPERDSESAPAVVETQYVFPSRQSFERYLRDHAPALRADGLRNFPEETGITYSRQVAEIAAEFPEG